MLAQLDKDEWNEQVKDALKHWHETDRLNQHPLAAMEIVERQVQGGSYAGDPFRRAKALRQVLKTAIEAMGVEGETPPNENNSRDPRWMDRRWRHYSMLTLSLNYIQREVSERIGVALGGQFYRDQARAIEALAEVLRNQEGSPISAASTAALSYPSGAVKLDDPFYIERDVDIELAEALKRPGETITIRGPRQVGKTSLLTRGIHHGQRQFGARLVYLDLQEGAGEKFTESLDIFLHALAVHIFDELDLDLDVVEGMWSSQLPAQRKLMKLLERHVLANNERPVLLAMDEIDRLQFTDFPVEFFALMRSWHNRRATHPIWNKLSILMAISTEPYLLIDDLNQSPFNVGQVLYLNDFEASQTAELNRRYRSPAGPDELPRMLLLLNGHPYLTRVALYTMVVNKLAWSDLEKVAISDQGPFHQHLQLQYRLLLRDERLKDTFREIVRTNGCTDEGAGFRLMKAGLVTRLDSGGYECRCDLYRRYFAEVL
jgi:hypothetical protein